MKQCTYRNFTITIKERDYLHHHPYFLAHLVAYISEHILQSTMDNAQGDSPGQPVTCLEDCLAETRKTVLLNQTTSALIKHFV